MMLPEPQVGTGRTRSSLIDSAYDAYCRLQKNGTPVSAESFCARYPELRSSLGRLLQVDRNLRANPQLLLAPLGRWPEAGEEFLGFPLLALLGQGAFARVFLACEPALGERLVAVKISPSGAAEALTLGRLRHPHIVPVHSVQTDPASGLTAICMPYLGSATLSDVLEVIRAAPETPRRASLLLEVAGDAVPAEAAPVRVLREGSFADGVRHLALRLLEALAFVHDNGVLHRDLKPSNILLTEAGVPMLLDFNLAQDARRQSARIGGTLPYMAPEQLRGLLPGPAQALDRRADLFSLGVIVHELLTGTHPFGMVPRDGPVPELAADLLRRQHEGPRPLRPVVAHRERDLAELVERCLAYDPADRPASAQAAAALLRPDTPRARRPKRTIALGISLALAAAAGVFLVVPMGRMPDDFGAGQEAYRHGAWEDAIAHFGKALQADPDNDRAWLARGLAFQKRAEADQRYFGFAAVDFKTADQLHPQGRTKACLGYALQQQTRLDEAELCYQAAVRSGFDTALVQNNLGLLYLRTAKLDRAERALNRALELDPQLQPALHNRSLLYLQKALAGAAARSAEQQQQNLARGLADVRRAIALGPAGGELLLNAARLCAVAARHDPRQVPAALDYLEQSLDSGADPAQLARNSTFSALHQHPRFGALCQRTLVPHPAAKAVRLLAPVTE